MEKKQLWDLSEERSSAILLPIKRKRTLPLRKQDQPDNFKASQKCRDSLKWKRELSESPTLNTEKSSLKQSTSHVAKSSHLKIKNKSIQEKELKQKIFQSSAKIKNIKQKKNL